MDFNFEKNLSSIIDEMYENRDSTGDFLIHCNGVRIKCHQIVLSSCSPVFKTMMKCDMKERKNDETNLDTFAIQTIEKMVAFFYRKNIGPNLKVGDVVGQDTDYIALLHAADFFQVPLLKDICEYSLLNKMTAKSAIEYYKAAKLYNAVTLRKKSRKMIMFGKYEIMREPGWKESICKLNDIDLMADLLETCLVCKKQNHTVAQAYTTKRENIPGSFRYTESLVPATTLQHPCCYQQQTGTTYLSKPVYCYSTGSGPVKNNFFDDTYYFNGTTKHKENTLISSQALKEMVQNFALLFDCEDTTDVTLVMENGEKVKVHKSFVKANSKLLLEKITQENPINKMEKDILKFLYTGQIADYETIATALIEAANSYEMPKLRTYCEESLISSLIVGNVLERFIFASKNKLPKLRMKSLAMIQKENINVTNTNNWRDLAKDNVDIILELVMECFNSKSS